MYEQKVKKTQLQKIDTQLPDVIKNIPQVNPSDVKKKIKEELTETTYNALLQIGFAIETTGISLKESCLIAEVDYDSVLDLCDTFPEAATYLRMKEVKYKYKLMKLVNESTIENNDLKQAQWLLQAKFSDEYDPTYKRHAEKLHQGDETDIIHLAIAAIRKNVDRASPVTATAEPQAGSANAYTIPDDILNG